MREIKFRNLLIYFGIAMYVLFGIVGYVIHGIAGALLCGMLAVIFWCVFKITD